MFSKYFLFHTFNFNVIHWVSFAHGFIVIIDHSARCVFLLLTFLPCKSTLVSFELESTVMEYIIFKTLIQVVCNLLQLSELVFHEIVFLQWSMSDNSYNKDCLIGRK